MTSQEKDKFICKKLGLCWHDIKYGRCKYCGELGYDLSNPSFTSEAGRVQLLKLIMAAPENSNMVELRNILGSWRNTTLWFINPEYMTDDTGKFRDEVYEWLGGKE